VQLAFFQVNVKSKFWGSSLEIHPLGHCHIKLPLPAGVKYNSDAEHYTWRKVTTTVNNLIVGKLSITHLGDMVIRNWRTGDEVVLTFKPKSSGSSGSWFGWGGSADGGSTSKDNKRKSVSNMAEDEANLAGDIVGVLKDRNGVVRWQLSGSWGDRLTAVPVGSNNLSHLPVPLPLWIRRMPNPWAPQQFNQTQLAMTLNELPETLKPVLPPTDSRLRADQRAMEQGKWEEANKGKELLEVVQRDRRKVIVKQYESTGVPNGPPINSEAPPIPMGESWWNPQWFVRTVDEDTGEEHWVFTQEYWRCRNSGNWPEWVLDIFNPVDSEGDSSA
jgi:hypothetical protein